MHHSGGLSSGKYLLFCQFVVAPKHICHFTIRVHRAVLQGLCRDGVLARIHASAIRWLRFQNSYVLGAALCFRLLICAAVFSDSAAISRGLSVMGLSSVWVGEYFSVVRLFAKTLGWTGLLVYRGQGAVRR